MLVFSIASSSLKPSFFKSSVFVILSKAPLGFPHKLSRRDVLEFCYLAILWDFGILTHAPSARNDDVRSFHNACHRYPYSNLCRTQSFPILSRSHAGTCMAEDYGAANNVAGPGLSLWN